MSVRNYTTTIAAAKTISEIQAILAKGGASRIAVDYDTDANPIGMSFSLNTPLGLRLFTIPVNVDAMHELLVAESKAGRIKSGGMAVAKLRSREHAERVAWRVTKDWIDAQLTLVHSRMVALDEVMLPFMHTDDSGRTLYQAYADEGHAALGSRQ